jgi:FCD domain
LKSSMASVSNDHDATVRPSYFVGTVRARSTHFNISVSKSPGYRATFGLNGSASHTSLDSWIRLASVENVTTGGVVKNMSFSAFDGEVVGIFGLVGAGRSEIAQIARGARKRSFSLDATVRDLEQVTTLEDYIQLDREFHLRTYSRARMPQLLTMVERFWNSTQHFRRQFVKEAFAKDGLPFSDPQHLLLMDAIRGRDAEAAQLLVRLHIRRTRISIQAMEGAAASPAGSRRGAYATRTRKLTV